MPFAQSLPVVLAVGVFSMPGCPLAATITPVGSIAATTATDVAQTAPRRAQERGRARPAPMSPPTELTGQILFEFLLAEIALQRNEPVVAAQAYLELARRTQDPRIAQRATEVATFARAANLAVDAARIWQETDPASEEAPRVLAAMLVAAGRLDDARPFLERALAGKDSDTMQREQIFLQLGQLVSGVPDKRAVLALVRGLTAPYPREAAARFALAQAAVEADEDTLAVAEARAAAKLRPGWEPAALLEARVLQKKSSSAALASLRAFLADYPGAREVRLAYARTLITDKQYEAARKVFQGLTQDFPDNVDVIYPIALLSMQLEDWPLAERNLKRLLDLPVRDRAQVHLYLGQIAEDQKRYPEALDWYRQVRTGEQVIPARIREASVLSKQGDLRNARQLLQTTAAQSNQQRVQLQLAESQLLRDAKQEREAFELVERALDRLPNHPDLLYDHAMLAEKIDRLDVMESSLRKLIGIKPDHAHAYNALGYTFADRNIRLPEAKELIEKALKLAPDDYFIMDSMGWILFRQGDLEGALKYLERAYAGRPDAEIAAHLGEVFWMMGRRDEAEKLWRGAAAKGGDNETLQKTMRRFLATGAAQQ